MTPVSIVALPIALADEATVTGSEIPVSKGLDHGLGYRINSLQKKYKKTH